MKHFLTLLFLMVVFSAHAQKDKVDLYATDTVFTKADILPSFKNGDADWKKYLKQNLKYPRKAWWEEIESEVLVEFVVRYDGVITDVKNLTYAEHWGFEQEAVRLIKESGKWNAAILRGRKVSYYARLTIPFRLKY